MEIHDIRATYMTVSEAAGILEVSPQYIHSLRSREGFPRMEKLFNEYVLRRSEFMAWAKEYRPKGKRRKP